HFAAIRAVLDCQRSGIFPEKRSQRAVGLHAGRGDRTQALISNDVSFIKAGGGGVVDAVLGGADLVMIACPIAQEPQVLVTRREIKELRQLKGKNSRSIASPVRRC